MARSILFNKYLSSGFLESHIREAHIKGNLAAYAYNFGPLLPRDLNSRILDIGCGMGEFIAYLQQLCYSNYEGVEIGREQVEYCRQHVTDRVQLIDSLPDYLAAHQACFDAVVMIDVLDHMPKDKTVTTLSLVRQSLRNGGIFLLKVENMASLTAISKRYDDFTHELGFTEHSLSQVLAVAGFNEVRIRPFRIPPIGIKSWMRGIAQTFQHTIWKVVLRIEGGGQRIVMPALFAVARTFSETPGSDLNAPCEQ